MSEALILEVFTVNKSNEGNLKIDFIFKFSLISSFLNEKDC